MSTLSISLGLTRFSPSITGLTSSRAARISGAVASGSTVARRVFRVAVEERLGGLLSGQHGHVESA